MTVENEKLKKENKELKAENLWLRTENTRLQQRLEMLETTMEDSINKAVEEAVAKAAVPLLETIKEKDKEILRPKLQIGKDSPNSSKPSSSNELKKFQITVKKVTKNVADNQGIKAAVWRYLKTWRN